MRRMLMALAALAIAGPAAAEDERPACAAVSDANLPVALAGWGAKAALSSASDAASLPSAELQVGHAASAALYPTPQVAYVARPEKPGGAVSKGGLFQLTIATAWVYRVALGAASWIDVLNNAVPVPSSAHSPGPACSSVRKMVDFALTPGTYVVQISGSAADKLPILVARGS